MERTSKGAGSLANILYVIAIIGAINWGLIGFFNFNLVDAIFGGGARETTSALSRIIYAIVGLCGLFAAFFVPRMRFISKEEAATTRHLGARREVHP